MFLYLRDQTRLVKANQQMRQTYFSPAWRSPTPFLQTTSWRPQVIIPQPVGSVPLRVFCVSMVKSGKAGAGAHLYPGQPLCQKTGQTHFFLLSERLHKLHVGAGAGEIHPPILNAGVCQPAGNFLPLEAKTCVDHKEDAIQKSTPRSASGSINSSKTEGMLTSIPPVLSPTLREDSPQP
jgi:hypothetical protein